MEGSRKLADVLEKGLQKETGVLRGASLLRVNPVTWHLLLEDPFAGSKMILSEAEKQSFILHVCCEKRKFPYVSNKKNVNMDKLRKVCFNRIETIMASAKEVDWAPIRAGSTSLELIVWIDKQYVYLTLCFPVHRNSLVATCPHSARIKRKRAEVSSSVTYFTSSRNGPPAFCQKADLPTEMQGNVHRRSLATGPLSPATQNQDGVSKPDLSERYDRLAESLLRRVEEGLKETVRRNAETVGAFAERLQKTFHTQSLLAGADVMHSGSAYEGLTVKPKTDFDVIVVLALECLKDGFEVIRDESLFLMLETKAGFLHAEKLQEQLFKELTECVEKTKVDGASVRCREGLASLDVEIETAFGKISVDLSPQIPVRSWGKCPDLVSLSDLPRCLRRYIDMLNRNKSPVMFFSPAVPGRHSNGHLLCNVSFSMLEKRFLRENANLRNMVRLAKATAVCQEWKEKFGLKSFHIKRVAVKYSDEFEGKGLWSGYQLLLDKLLEELASTDTFDGFFISNQVIYKKKPEKVDMLKGEIRQVIPWSASKLKNKWDEYARQS